MDLSQVKIPYNPPVPPDSPNYNPSYSTYYDPNEDSSYHFDFNTNEYKRTETGGPLGQVSLDVKGKQSSTTKTKVLGRRPQLEDQQKVWPFS